MTASVVVLAFWVVAILTVLFKTCGWEREGS